MATTVVKFDFFKLVDPDRRANAYELIKTGLARVNVPFTRRGIPVRVETFKDDRNDCVYGTASATALTNLPVVVAPDTPGMRDLQLGNNEGLASLTAFLVTKLGNDVFVVLHSNNRGVRAAGFMHLLQLLTGIDNWEFSYLVNEAAIRRALAFPMIKKFEAKLTQPGDPARYQTMSASSAARMAGEVEAKDIRFTLSAGRGPVSLLAGAVKAAVDDLLRFKHQEVTVLKITGKEFDEEPPEMIDLLAQRFKEIIELPGSRRVLDPDTIERAVQQAFDAKKEELRTAYAV